MRIPVHFIFIPTQQLVEAAREVARPTLAEYSVWTTHLSDPSGLHHSQNDVESAFWSIFQANLVSDNETNLQRQFRTHCLQLGFHGCWSVVQTKGGGPAEELIAMGSEAISFLAAIAATDRPA